MAYFNTTEQAQDLEIAYQIISEHLTDTNNHTVAKLLDFALGKHEPEQDEIFYRATLAARDFIGAFKND